MIDFNVKSNMKDFKKQLDAHTKKQLPFATMKALNQTSAEMRKGVIEHIRQKQKSSKTWWNHPVNGILRIFATKSNLVVVLYTKIYWSEIQEEGGIKKGRGKIAIPLDRVPKSMRKAGGARKMGAQSKTYFTKKGLFRKAGGKKSPRSELLFWFTKTAMIKPLLGFKKTAHKIAIKKFPKYHAQWMEKAIKTAK